MDGSAKQAVGGLPVTNEAYKEGFILSKHCYENLQIALSWIKLEKVVNSNAN